MPFLHNEKEYARVSDVLAPFTNFSGIPPEVLEAKRDIGTEVHGCIEQLINDELPIPSKRAKGYLDSFLSWMKQLSPTFTLSEKRFFCDDLMLTGCIDSLLLLPNSDLPILTDYKTSAQESKTWVMQGHLYYYLLKKNGYHIGDVMLFIKLNKDGLAPIAYSYRYNSNVYAQCLDAISSYWKNSGCLKR